MAALKYLLAPEHRGRRLAEYLPGMGVFGCWNTIPPTQSAPDMSALTVRNKFFLRYDKVMKRRNWTRRQFLLATSSVLATACAPSRVAPGGDSGSLAVIEARAGGRVGVFALDTGNGRHLAHRSDERFAMCSTFKWVLTAAILARVDRARLSLDEHLPYGPDALLEYAPVTREHVAEGFMTVRALAEAAVTLSDNTAANLLLAKLGGPAAFTEFVRSLGDSVTRLDRNEPALNSNAPADLRDTTSPHAMVGLMRKVLCGDGLSSGGRELLLSWLRANQTGKERLRAGLPQDWVVGDKTGTGQRGAVNDVAIAVPPGRAPILIAAYLSDGTAGSPALAAAHAEIGRLVTREF
jgi:beta-lactamase class A